jgi:hypothetical protein
MPRISAGDQDQLQVGLGDLQPVAIGVGDNRPAGACGLDHIFKQGARLAGLAATKQHQAVAGPHFEAHIVVPQRLIFVFRFGDPALGLKCPRIEQVGLLVLKLRMGVA